MYCLISLGPAMKLLISSHICLHDQTHTAVVGVNATPGDVQRNVATLMKEICYQQGNT